MSKKIFMIIASLLAIIILAAFTLAQKKSIEFKDITFKVIPDKDSYIKGEPVKLRVELTNNSDYTMKFGEPHEGRFWITKEGRSYKYFESDPRDCSTYDSSLLKANQSWSKDMETILWNTNRRDYSRFASDTKQMELEDSKTRIVTEYVFQDVGTYNATVRTSFKDEKGEKKVIVEAEPAKINIKEPEGEDLEVWKQIEGNSSIALLMQQSDNFRGGDDKKQSALIREVEQIIINHPNSTYTKYLKEGVDKFKANAEKQKQTQ
jgi:uncharacterized protein YxeA